MHDDESAGTALGALAGEPVPAATTTLDEVVRKGKRRLRLQRATTVGGVAAVVAVIAAGTLLFHPDGGGTVPVASLPTTTAPSDSLSGYTEVSGPTMLPPVGTTDTGTGGVPPPSTQTTETTKSPEPPSADISASGPCANTLYTPFTKFVGSSPDNVRDRFVAGFVAAVHRKPAGLQPSLDQPGQPRIDGSQRVIAYDNGGEVVLDLLGHDGTPLEAADAAVGAETKCVAAKRKTQPDGTILQLYPRGTANQMLTIFAPDGRTYVLTVVANQNWPVTEAQLATIADEMAKTG